MISGAAVLLTLGANATAQQQQPSGVEQPPAAADKPPAPRYVVNYPAAVRFCPPLRSYFEDVTQAVQQSGYHTFRHQLNGGYGLPIRVKVAGQNVLHLGADVGWYRAGDPVFAIANGVVRVSEGPPAVTKRSGGAQRAGRAASSQPTASATLQWGNLIAIEHRLADGTYITSICGHLASERLVAAGDVVEAGKIIGKIGKTGAENGGYKPHLHFAVLEGRMAEPGSVLFTALLNGRQAPITLVGLTEQEIEVKTDEDLPPLVTIAVGDRTFTMTARDGKRWMPADFLHVVRRPDFQIVGYGLSTKGWRDPTEFLRQVGADVNPAQFEVKMPTRKKAASTREGKRS